MKNYFSMICTCICLLLMIITLLSFVITKGWNAKAEGWEVFGIASSLSIIFALLSIAWKDK